MIGPASMDSMLIASGPLGQTVRESALTKTRLDTLTEQSATGKISQSFGGLGSVAQVSLDLRPQIERTQVWSQNINAVTTRLTSASNVLDQLQQIASNINQATLDLPAQAAGSVDTLATQAQNALSQVQSLLNTRIGGVYIFAGQDTANPPVPDTQFNAYVQSIKTATTGLTATNGATIAAATLTAANATSPFAPTLGTSRQQVQIGFTQSVSAGIAAGTNAFGPSTGPSTTGSYVRDLIRSLATLSALSSGQAALDPGFTDLMTDTRTSIQGVMSAVANDSSFIGIQQQTLTQSQTDLTNTRNALITQVSSVEDVDMAATATALTQTQSQLQISYKLIASMQNLSLLNYL